MKQTTETGHAKNVANFKDLIAFCKGHGTAYNPVNPTLLMANLESVYAQAEAVLKVVKTNENAFDNATNKRTDTFKPLRPLATRIINALDATEASEETVKDARTINRKLQGQRANAAKKEAPVPEGQTPGSKKKISASQQSFDLQIDHFDKLVTLLAAEPNYNPNETDLKLTAVKSVLAELKTANSNVINMYEAWSNSRIARNNILYKEVTGLLSAALDVKKYILSVFGARSPQYKQVSGLLFRFVKD